MLNHLYQTTLCGSCFHAWSLTDWAFPSALLSDWFRWDQLSSKRDLSHPLCQPQSVSLIFTGINSEKWTVEQQKNLQLSLQGGGVLLLSSPQWECCWGFTEDHETKYLLLIPNTPFCDFPNWKHPGIQLMSPLWKDSSACLRVMQRGGPVATPWYSLSRNLVQNPIDDRRLTNYPSSLSLALSSLLQLASF